MLIAMDSVESLSQPHNSRLKPLNPQRDEADPWLEKPVLTLGMVLHVNTLNFDLT